MAGVTAIIEVGPGKLFGLHGVEPIADCVVDLKGLRPHTSRRVRRI